MSSQAITSIVAALQIRASNALEPVDVHRLVQAVVRSSAAPADGRGSRGRRRCSRGRRAGRGRRRRAGPRPPCAATAAAPCGRRGSAAARARSWRSSASARRTSAHRAAPARAACRTVFALQVARTRPRAGSCALADSDRTIASSVAAACSSKLNLRQKRLRSARPQARLMRLPNGACMHQLHAARFVEEALQHDASCASAARRARLRRGEVVDDLLGGRRGRQPQRARSSQATAASRAAGVEPNASIVFAQARHRRTTARRCGRRLAEPERDARRRALRVLDPHRAALRRAGCATRCCRAGTCRRPGSRPRSPR